MIEYLVIIETISHFNGTLNGQYPIFIFAFYKSITYNIFA